MSIVDVDFKRIRATAAQTFPSEGVFCAAAYSLIFEASKRAGNDAISPAEMGFVLAAAAETFDSLDEAKQAELFAQGALYMERTSSLATPNSGRFTTAELAELLKDGGDA